MSKPNYQFEKRQRALAKRNKQEEKRLQRLAAKAAADSSLNAAPDAPRDQTSNAGSLAEADPTGAAKPKA